MEQSDGVEGQRARQDQMTRSGSLAPHLTSAPQLLSLGEQRIASYLAQLRTVLLPMQARMTWAFG